MEKLSTLNSTDGDMSQTSPITKFNILEPFRQFQKAFQSYFGSFRKHSKVVVAVWKNVIG